MPDLDLKAKQIRLLQILPAGDTATIQCITSTHELDGDQTFFALSYTWGSPPAQHEIKLNGQSFFVRKNLWRFLRQARELSFASGQFFWIDAICIDQSNNHERTHQVDLMPTIYSRASHVVVWLGPSHNNSTIAMEFLRQPKARRPKANAHVWSEPAGLGIAHLCYRAYWGRLWIYQELVLASEIWLLCGSELVEWNALIELWSAVQNFREGSRVESQPAYHMFKQSPALKILDSITITNKPKSLWDYMHATAHLECADLRDKVYGLLGVCKSGCRDINADYNLPLPTLLNRVLRNYHELHPPTSLKRSLEQCRYLEKLLGLHPGSLLSLHDQRGAFNLDHDEMDRMPLKHSVTGISLWWTGFYGHDRIEVLLYSEEAIKLPIEVIHAISSGSSAALSLITSSRWFDPMMTTGQGIPLHHAIKTCDEDIVRILLRQSRRAKARALRLPGLPLVSDVKSRHQYGSISMHDRPGYADLSFRDWNGESALHLAVHVGHPGIVKLLVDTGRADFGAQDHNGRTALHMAAMNGIYEVFEILHGADQSIMNYRDHHGQTVLHQAAISDVRSCSDAYGKKGGEHKQIVELLVGAQGVDFSCKDKHQRTALHYASMGGKVEIAKLLIAADKSVINESDKYFRSACDYAIEDGHWDIVDSLLSTNEVDLRMQDGKNNALFHAVAKGNEKIIQSVIAASIPTANKRLHGYMLWIACSRGFYGSVRRLLALTESCSTRDGITPHHRGQALLAAAYGGHLEIIRLLVNEHSSVRELAIEKQSPFFRQAYGIAVSQKHAELISFLELRE